LGATIQDAEHAAGMAVLLRTPDIEAAARRFQSRRRKGFHAGPMECRARTRSSSRAILQGVPFGVAGAGQAELIEPWPSPHDVAKLALSFPDVMVGARYGNKTYLVGKKAFAWERPFSKAASRDRRGDAAQGANPRPCPSPI